MTRRMGLMTSFLVAVLLTAAAGWCWWWLYRCLAFWGNIEQVLAALFLIIPGLPMIVLSAGGIFLSFLAQQAWLFFGDTLAGRP